MKELIIQLRSEGKKYTEIKTIVGCSLSTVCYHLRPDQKSKSITRRKKSRFNKKARFKDSLGGKCQICGYDKYQGALHFHHVDPTQKKFGISDATARKKYPEEEVQAELKKCVLVCANCHAEIHANLIQLQLPTVVVDPTPVTS